jgi:hypothetical protein
MRGTPGAADVFRTPKLLLPMRCGNFMLPRKRKTSRIHKLEPHDERNPFGPSFPNRATLRLSTLSSNGAREQIACLLRDGSRQGQSVEPRSPSPQFLDDPPLRLARFLDISADIHRRVHTARIDKAQSGRRRPKVGEAIRVTLAIVPE